jgi:hypothetical protein
MLPGATHPVVARYYQPYRSPYSRGRRTTPSVVSRFWPRVDRSAGPDGCWEWQGYRNRSGYGEIGAGGKDRGNFATHRLALELATGQPIPDGMWALHHCDNPPCVNPLHLYVGDRQQNVADAVARDRFARPRNELSVQARLSDLQVADIRSRWAGGESCADLGRAFGVSDNHVNRIVRGLVRPLKPNEVLPQRAIDEAAEYEALWMRAEELYRGGLSTTAVGRAIGRDASIVSRRLRERGVRMREPGQIRPPADGSVVKVLHEKGLTSTQIMQELGIGRKRLYEAYEQMGIPRAPAGRPRRVAA